MPTWVDKRVCPEWGIISDGVQKRSGRVVFGICSVEALCTPAEVFAYAERIRSTPVQFDLYVEDVPISLRGLGLGSTQSPPGGPLESYP